MYNGTTETKKRKKFQLAIETLLLPLKKKLKQSPLQLNYPSILFFFYETALVHSTRNLILFKSKLTANSL